jgi:hypothetical protein
MDLDVGPGGLFEEFPLQPMVMDLFNLYVTVRLRRRERRALGLCHPNHEESDDPKHQISLV